MRYFVYHICFFNNYYYSNDITFIIKLIVHCHVVKLV